MNDHQPHPTYSVETLQKAYALTLPQAVTVIERFGSERKVVDKLMKHCRGRFEIDHR